MRPPLLYGLLTLMISVHANADRTKLAIAVVTEEEELKPLAVATWYEISRTARRDPRYKILDFLSPVTNDAKAKLEEEKQAFESSADPDKDVAKLEEIIQTIKSGDLSNDFDDLKDSIALQAMFAFDVSREPRRSNTGVYLEQATERLKQLFVLDADYQAWPREKVNRDGARTRVPPKEGFKKLAEEIRGKVRGLARADLLIATSVPALVFVDGAYEGVSKGEAPMRLGGLLPGEHYVRVEAPGFTPFQAVALPGRLFEIRMEQWSKRDALAKRLHDLTMALSGDFWKAARSFGQRGDADQVLVVRLRPGKGEVEALAAAARTSGGAIFHVTNVFPGVNAAPNAAQSAQDSEFDKTKTTPLDDAAAEAKRISDMAAQLLTPLDVYRMEPPELWPCGKNDPRRSGCMMLGISAIAALGGVGLGWASSVSFEQANRIPQVDHERFQQTYSAGQRLAIGADVLFGASLLLAGIGGWHLATADKSRVPDDRFWLSVAPTQHGGSLLLNARFR